MADIKNVAVLFSGGKDSTYAVEYCLERGWNIKYLLSVKPTRKDCYLFHYATVEHTSLQAEALGLKHRIISCSVADPEQEAALVKKAVAQEPVDAVLLGGVGLQVTQIQSIQKALLPLGIEVFASHGGEDHGALVEDRILKGYKIMITQVAGDGLKNWLGKILTKDNFKQLQQDSVLYGIHSGGEGGSYDSYVLDAPFFKQQVHFQELEVIRDGECTGHVEIQKSVLLPKQITLTQ